ncbi:hypothetical protein MCEREM21A_02338 [Sphingomonadaceae bacterium]
MLTLLLVVSSIASGSLCKPMDVVDMVTLRSGSTTVVAPDTHLAREALAAVDSAKRTARLHLGLTLRSFLLVPSAPLNEHRKAGCDLYFEWPFFLELRSRRLNRSSMQHEIGHEVFIRYLAPPSGRAEYGGQAPDWLDEMAAIVFEDKAATEDRRLSAVLYNKRKRLIPVSRLFAMRHPEWVDKAQLSAPVVIDTSRPDSQPYYATVRVLLDYLLHKTGDSRIIASLATQSNDASKFVLEALDANSHDELDEMLTSFVDANTLYQRSRDQALRLSR